jgi:catechol 2,3-dioxygenase-like lactoylglutathione lyase family enzyme
MLVAVAGFSGLNTASAEEVPVQSVLLRAVTVTCKLEESIAFYRDIMGQEVMLNEPTGGSPAYLNIKPDTEVRFVIMRGSGAYPGGEIIGGRIAFLGITDPNDPACKNDPYAKGRGNWGAMVLPHRVANVEEIAARARKAGIEIFYGPGPSGTRLSNSMMMKDPNGNIVELFEINIQRIP